MTNLQAARAAFEACNVSYTDADLAAWVPVVSARLVRIEEIKAQRAARIAAGLSVNPKIDLVARLEAMTDEQFDMMAAAAAAKTV